MIADPQFREDSGQYAFLIVNLGVGAGIRCRFGGLASQSFSSENHAILLKNGYLQIVAKYFT